MPFRVLSIGEILFDHFPTYKRLGGAPFNVAFHLHRLGMETIFVSRVGKDGPGEEIISRLTRLCFPAEWIQIDEEFPTGEVQVHPDENGVPDFTIIQPSAYDRIEMNATLERKIKKGIDLLYFGTLAQRNDITRNTIHRILDSLSPQTPVLYDVNLRHPFYNREIIQSSLTAASIVKLNHEEFETIREMFAPGEDDVRSAYRLMERFGIIYLCITHGEQGSELFHPAGREVVRFEEGTSTGVIDTVGAGDGYTAVLAMGIRNRWQPRETIAAASEFAAKICRIPGAIPEGVEFYENFRKNLEL